MTPVELGAVLSYVDDNIAADLSVTQLARISGFSTSHFKVLFKRTTGVSVHRYVMRRRVERALQLLARRNVRLCEVALATGFADQSHMARCIRRTTGMTPGAYVASTFAGRKEEGPQRILRALLLGEEPSFLSP